MTQGGETLDAHDRVNLEFVVGDLLRWNPECFQHAGACLDHHGGAAKIVFDGGGIRVPGKMLLEHDLVNQSDVAGPVVLGQRSREREIEGEIVMRPGEILKIIRVEDFLF